MMQLIEMKVSQLLAEMMQLIEMKVSQLLAEMMQLIEMKVSQLLAAMMQLMKMVLLPVMMLLPVMTVLDAKGYQDLFKVIDPRGAGVVDCSSLRYLASFHDKLSREDVDE
eukprot:Selendium_serpulae@DN11192_c0_g1_i1.p1